MADQEFIKQYLKTTVDDGFVKVKDTQRSTEYADDHFGQFYKGIKVDGGGYNFHYKNGKMFYAHGHFVKIDNLNVSAEITGVFHEPG